MTSELDAGQAIAQSAIEVKEHDNVASLAERVHKLEHFIYPQVAEWLCNGQLTWKMDKPISAIKFLNTLSVLHLGKSLLNNN